jgi:hypothetical protein
MSDDYMHDAKARKFLIRQTLKMLVQPSEDRKYNGQLLEPIEFLRSIGDRLLLMPFDEFEKEVIDEAVKSIARAIAELTVEEPVKFQRVLPFRPWQDGGIWVQ